MYGILDDIEKDINRNWVNILSNEYNNKLVDKYTNYFYLMDGIIELNKNNRNENIKHNLGIINYLKEYCTIKLDIGRQIGKSEYIKRNANKDDVIIVLNNNLKRQFYNIECDVFSLSYVLDREIKNRYKIIWFDNFLYCSKYGEKKQYIENKIYRIFVNNNIEQTFIFLG